MWCHWKQVTRWRKMGHFSKQSKCFNSFAGRKLNDSTLKIHQGLVKVVGSTLLHTSLSEDGIVCFVRRTRATQLPTLLVVPRQPHTKKMCLQLHQLWRQIDPHVCRQEMSSELALSLGTVQKTPMATFIWASLKLPTIKTILMFCTWLTWAGLA